MTKTAQDYADHYTKPKLREKLKEEIKDGDKGGKPGQWSARKSQLLTQRYEAEGGDYKGEKTDAQQSLEDWTNEEWQTQEGNAQALGGGKNGSTKRYLPKKAWDLLSDDEKRRTDQKKQLDGEKRARQFVDNTAKARAARKFVSHGDAGNLTLDMLERLDKAELDDIAADEDITGRSSMNKAELARAIHDNSEADDPSKRELYEQAKEQDVEGRSKMSKKELAEAVG
jgi:hypothetical protein